MRLWHVILGAAAVVFATSGFECASSEMTSAKVDYSNHRYDRARASLETEVHRSPGNEEAWYYLALTAHEQRDHVRVADACDSAGLAGSQFKVKLFALRQNEWVETWNSAVSMFNAAGDNKDSLLKAASLFALAYRLDPTDAEPIRLLGATYLAVGDTAKALDAYQKYIDGIDENVKKGVEMGLVLGESVDQVMKDFGKPETDKVLPTVDSAHLLSYPSKNLMLFVGAMAGESGDAKKLVGWRVSSGKKDGSERLDRLTAEPYRMVGNIYYQRGYAMLRGFEAKPTQDSAGYHTAVDLMNKAAGYFSVGQQLNPSDEFASTMLSEIYLRTNQLNKAIAAYQELIKKFPSNKFTRLNYGVLLLKGNNYEQAVQQFEAALQVDPAYRQSQYYLAITYKNWSADMQSASRRSGAKETADDREKYISKLRKAAQYFEQMHQGDPKDFAPLSQLAEIYAIVREADKLKQTLGKLEAMESAQSDNAEYWETLGRVYTVLSDAVKAKAAYAKAEALAHK